jgi:hypothetical protein
MNNSKQHKIKRQPIIVVKHAAACIGLAKAGTKWSLSEINPAGPCCIYRLDRDSTTTSISSSTTSVTSLSSYDANANNIPSLKNNGSDGTSTWTVDRYAKPHNGMNGYLGLDQLGDGHGAMEQLWTEIYY